MKRIVICIALVLIATYAIASSSHPKKVHTTKYYNNNAQFLLASKSGDCPGTVVPYGGFSCHGSTYVCSGTFTIPGGSYCGTCDSPSCMAWDDININLSDQQDNAVCINASEAEGTVSVEVKKADFSKQENTVESYCDVKSSD